jgi:2-polyprenyl-6-methoxyphenol hydroxylase-like FAD-dependent oxidoreductase
VTRALVIGGGIGGLTTGVALRQAGLDTVVFERTPEYHELGTGLHIAINAMRGLRELGLADEVVRRAGTPIERMEFLNQRGQTLMEWPSAELTKRFGVPAVGVTRPTLHAVLVDAIGDSLRLGTECKGFTQDGDGVTVTLADGSEERGDLLVGADGIWSKTRIAMLGESELRYAGYTTARAIIDFDTNLAPPGLFRQYWGRGAVFITYRVADGRLYWVAATRAEAGRDGDVGVSKAALAERYRGFAEPVPQIVDETPEDVIVGVDAKDRPPADRWGDDRVTLLGDAAHPMSPTQGQGACQAIEDAVVLGKSLSGNGDIPGALRAYEERRIPRTSKFVRQSWTIGSIGRWQNPIACALRDRLLRAGGKRAFTRVAKEMAYEF